MKKVIRFTQERLTKNTVRFQEEVNSQGDTPAIGTLYVQQAVFGGQIPQHITVTIETDGA